MISIKLSPWLSNKKEKKRKKNKVKEKKKKKKKEEKKRSTFQRIPHYSNSRKVK